jgi:hypothetical protein
MHREGRIVHMLDPTFGFMHTPQEMVQALSILRRERVPPAEIGDLVSIQDTSTLAGADDLFAAHYGEADVIGVEISSLRYAVYDGWVLQVNRVRDRLLAAGLEMGVPYSAIVGGTALPEEGELLLAESDPLLLDVMKSRQFYSMSRDDLKDSVEKLIVAIGKPVLLIGHFVDTGPFKGVNPSRQLIAEVLQEIADEQETVGFLDPTGHISAFGFERALADDSHYTSKYFVRAGDKIVRASREVYLTNQPQ